MAEKETKTKKRRGEANDEPGYPGGPHADKNPKK